MNTSEMSSTLIETEIMKEWSEKWFQFILDNPDKPWDWDKLSRNPNVTWDIVQQNPDIPWDWSQLSFNEMTNARKHFFDKKLKEYK